jgi:hypothetical protein
MKRDPPEPQLENLVIAMLAVSQYPIERALGLRDRLRDAGLLDPRNLATWTVARVADELRSSGYDRGRLTSMYADRLVSLGKVYEGERERCEEILREGSDEAVRQLLAPWHGIGPTVIASFLNLRRRSAKD